MLADGFDYKIAAGLHKDRLAEAESIRCAEKARMDSTSFEVYARKQAAAATLKYRIGRQLIALGERMTA
ncbi:MAG: hypothetical protein PQJ61_00300 [Spirochaetales bacterium]|uniref:Uncharacterized protein n=1 Tax=Candidatus Thalassospirochaeta sargassi TaxID=3119039 RepID=A0AAJ1MHD1_9SPIO|nr:hypothetical protein [Spirochaetales bacterium]